MSPENDREGERRRAATPPMTEILARQDSGLLSMRGFLLQTMAKTQLRRLASYRRLAAQGLARFR